MMAWREKATFPAGCYLPSSLGYPRQSMLSRGNLVKAASRTVLILSRVVYRATACAAAPPRDGVMAHAQWRATSRAVPRRAYARINVADFAYLWRDSYAWQTSSSGSVRGRSPPRHRRCCRLAHVPASSQRNFRHGSRGAGGASASAGADRRQQRGHSARSTTAAAASAW